MNANDLMIGDWAKFIQPDGKEFYARVVALNDDEAFTEEGYYSNNMVAPIPLTVELLERNGFDVTSNKRSVVCDVRTEYHHIKIEFTDKIAIEVHNALAGKDGDGRCDLVSFGRDWFDVIYVHEFQHILRLCGIEMEIEL